jgi:uncharacterized membrane protein YraQ (UPF0718 family)
MQKASVIATYAIPSIVIGFSLGAKLFGFAPGEFLLGNLISYLKTLCLLLPPVFILIGLFEVWIPRQTIEKHFGKSHGAGAWIWLILLASTIVGGLYVSLPLSYALYKKGVRLRLVIAFLGFSTVCRIPMTFFEASFLGLKFTIIRYLIALPLIIFTAIILENIIQTNNNLIS